MTANLSKNGVTLMAAYKDVVDGRSHANWAVFTYEGDSSIVRLAGKGEGGLEEMVEELSSGKVMYAFCCVKDPNSGLPKYVLINWIGEGVKDSRKGVYANHVTSMANFLKGAHVTINARAEEDIEPATILAKVAKASGVNFNFLKKTTEHSHEPRGPVGSVYKKTNARDEVQSPPKERFWGQTQRDEKVSPKVAGKRLEEETQRVEREKREREERQAREREKREKEKSPSIVWNRSFQKIIQTEKGKMEQQHAVSVYKKINARDEIQKTNKDHFWVQIQKEEEDRRKESGKRAEEEKRTVEREKRELEERQAKGRGKGGNEKKALIIQNSSFQKILEIEKRDKEQQKTVSVYKKINARDEIQKRDHFWAQTQKAEEERRKESSKRADEEKETVQREKRELEERQAREREKREKENRALIIHNSFQKKQEMERIDQTQQKTHTKDEQPRPNKTYRNTGIQTAESVQKANEAKLLISQRSFNPRDVFKQQNLQSPCLNHRAPPTPQPGKLRSPFLSQKSGADGATALEPKRLLSPSPASVVRKAPSSSSSSTVSVGRVAIAPPPVRSDPPVASPSSGLYENDYLPVQPSDNASSEDEWSDEFEDDDDYADMDGHYETEEPVYDELYEDIPMMVEDHSLKARALYDYQAANDTEISFDPHNLIIGIEKVDEGWWRGYAPNGHYGLFPANYVELL